MRVFVWLLFWRFFFYFVHESSFKRTFCEVTRSYWNRSCYQLLHIYFNVNNTNTKHLKIYENWINFNFVHFPLASFFFLCNQRFVHHSIFSWITSFRIFYLFPSSNLIRNTNAYINADFLFQRINFRVNWIFVFVFLWFFVCVWSSTRELLTFFAFFCGIAWNIDSCTKWNRFTFRLKYFELE